MSKRRQHYVPKFYLKGFQSAPHRINLYHLASRRAIREAGLKDQCYAHRFYGPSDEVEDSLAELEDVAAPLVRRICESGEPPAFGTEQHGILLAFVSLQLMRTPVARKKIQDSWVKMDAQVFGDRDPSPESGLSRFSPVSDHEVLRLQLGTLPQHAEALSDLQIHIARTGPRERLVTSDNPVFKYNSYCRGIRYWGVTGAYNCGLQIFLPLSPNTLLLLYDGSVYVLGEERGDWVTSTRLSRADVERLNAAQIINSENCIYFSDWSHAEEVSRLARTHLSYKQNDLMRVDEGELIGSENSSIVHLWEKQPELRFTLPLSSLRLRARKLPLKERATAYRREWNG